MKSAFPLLALTLLVLGCTTPPNSLRPAQLASNYPSLAKEPLAGRITPAPAVLLDDLKVSDQRDYRNHTFTDADRAATAEGWEALPAPLRRALEDHVLGVSFLDNFAGGGMTWDLYDAQGNEAGFWLIFNSALLSATASQWLTFRDNTAFAPDPSMVLSETATTEISAFQFLLTHEAAHVFDFVHGVTPVAREILAKKPVTTAAGDFGFGRTYPLNAGWHFYDLVPGPKPAADTLPAALDVLEGSGFASLYGSQTALEDWAELVTYGLLAQEAGVEFTLRLSSSNSPDREWSPTSDAAVLLRIADVFSRLEAP